MLMHRIKYFLELLKFRLSATVVFSALAGYLLASHEVSFLELFFLATGGFLVTGSANGFNQILEINYDKLMVRTCERPLPKNNLNVNEAFIFSLFIGVVGLCLLYQLNKYCTYYGIVSILLYVLMAISA